MNSARSRWRGESENRTVLEHPYAGQCSEATDLEFYLPAEIRRRIQDLPVWLLSVIVHLLLLLLLALISTSSGAVEDLILTIRQGQNETNLELASFTIAPIELEVPSVAEEPFETNLETDLIELADPIDFASLLLPIDSQVPASDRPNHSVAPAANARRMFDSRTGRMKQELLRAGGGTKATEDAVSLGLQWLKRNQLNDGSWSLRGPYEGGARSENRVAATAMAMLAFMGAGSTHLTGDYKDELSRGVRWLVRQQDRQGFMAVQAAAHEQMYAQAQAMIALCELYAMTSDTWIRPYAQRSCDFASRAQSPAGGWRYRARIDSDTSVTGWFVVGLKSAESAGLKVDVELFDRVGGYLDTVSASRDGGYYDVGYSYKVGDAPSPSMTAEGLLCRQYLGWHRNVPTMRRCLDTLVQNHPINMREPDVYYWYYATQSLHHFGGPMWTQWNDKLKIDLPAAQQNRGPERGSWSPRGDAWGRHAGRLYTTCFSLYCLEVYYRHMPIYAHGDLDDV